MRLVWRISCLSLLNMPESQLLRVFLLFPFTQSCSVQSVANLTKRVIVFRYVMCAAVTVSNPLLPSASNHELY